MRYHMLAASVALLCIFVGVQGVTASARGGPRSALYPDEVLKALARGVNPKSPAMRAIIQRMPVTAPRHYQLGRGGVVRTSGLDILNRPVGVGGLLRGKEALGKGSPVAHNVKVAGYKPGCGLHRGHLIARALGGPGDDVANLVPVPVVFNKSIMRIEEIKVARALADNKEVFLRVTPHYAGKNVTPKAVHYEAFIRANNKDTPFINKMLRVPGFVGPLPPGC